jgi:hypothetical protein
VDRGGSGCWGRRRPGRSPAWPRRRIERGGRGDDCRGTHRDGDRWNPPDLKKGRPTVELGRPARVFEGGDAPVEERGQ